MKKTYIQPLMKACEMDPNGLICGSGGDTQTMSLGGNDDGESPQATTQGGFTGIFGEAKGQGAFGDAW